MVTEEEGQAFHATVLTSQTASKKLLNKDVLKAASLVKYRNADGENVLHVVNRCEFNPTKILDGVLTVAYSIKQEAFSQKDSHGRTALASACHYAAHASIVERYLRESSCLVRLNETDHEGKTPLMLVVSSIATALQQVDILKHLLKAGAEVNVTDNEGYTVIHHAVKSGNKELLTTLIEEGKATPDLINMAGGSDRATPLHLLVLKKDVDDDLLMAITESLLAAGANPLTPLANGDSAIDLARKHRQQVLALLETHSQQGKGGRGGAAAASQRGVSRKEFSSASGGVGGAVCGAAASTLTKQQKKERDAKRIAEWKDKLLQLQNARIALEEKMEERRQMLADAQALNEETKRMKEEIEKDKKTTNDKAAAVRAREKLVEEKEREMTNREKKVVEKENGVQPLHDELERRKAEMDVNNTLYQERLNRLQRGEEDLANHGVGLEQRARQIKQAVQQLNARTERLRVAENAFLANKTAFDQKSSTLGQKVREWQDQKKSEMQAFLKGEREWLITEWSKLAEWVKNFSNVAATIRRHQASNTPLPQTGDLLPDLDHIMQEFHQQYEAAIKNVESEGRRRGLAFEAQMGAQGGGGGGGAGRGGGKGSVRGTGAAMSGVGRGRGGVVVMGAGHQPQPGSGGGGGAGASVGPPPAKKPRQPTRFLPAQGGQMMKLVPANVVFSNQQQQQQQQQQLPHQQPQQLPQPLTHQQILLAQQQRVRAIQQQTAIQQQRAQAMQQQQQQYLHQQQQQAIHGQQVVAMPSLPVGQFTFAAQQQEHHQQQPQPAQQNLPYLTTASAPVPATSSASALGSAAVAPPQLQMLDLSDPCHEPMQPLGFSQEPEPDDDFDDDVQYLGSEGGPAAAAEGGNEREQKQQEEGGVEGGTIGGESMTDSGISFSFLNDDDQASAPAPAPASNNSSPAPPATEQAPPEEAAAAPTPAPVPAPAPAPAPPAPESEAAA